jgi:hypothetical protein
MKKIMKIIYLSVSYELQIFFIKYFCPKKYVVESFTWGII